MGNKNIWSSQRSHKRGRPRKHIITYSSSRKREGNKYNSGINNTITNIVAVIVGVMFIIFAIILIINS